jgi:hypothetical protein
MGRLFRHSLTIITVAVLSLFTVVSFKNDACMSSAGSNGTCFSAKDCTQLGRQESEE